MRRWEYYNEFDAYAARWLENLIAAGHLPPGEVDPRDMREVDPASLHGFTSWHFFSGIGGWPLALKLAGFPHRRFSIMTGSPPCQPFSAAGKGLGVKDERHLAPIWLGFIRELRPDVVIGEQVAEAVWKDNWLDDLFDALEVEGYTAGAAILPACAVGAPHQRRRLFFVADRFGQLADAAGVGLPRGVQAAGGEAAPRGGDAAPASGAGGGGALAYSDGERRDGTAAGRLEEGRRVSSGDASDGALAYSERGRQSRPEPEHVGSPEGPSPCAASGRASGGGGDGPWSNIAWLVFPDGAARPFEPGISPLAHGIPARVGRLRAYGNAIVPQVAAEFVAAWMEVRGIEPEVEPWE